MREKTLLQCLLLLPYIPMCLIFILSYLSIDIQTIVAGDFIALLGIAMIIVLLPYTTLLLVYYYRSNYQPLHRWRRNLYFSPLHLFLMMWIYGVFLLPLAATSQPHVNGLSYLFFFFSIFCIPFGYLYVILAHLLLWLARICRLVTPS